MYIYEDCERVLALAAQVEIEGDNAVINHAFVNQVLVQETQPG
jgi:hypothetical protein